MKEKIKKNLTVIVGAGASYDCVDSSITTVNDGYRPPLTIDIFDPHDEFNEILNNYPKAEGLSDEIRTKLQGGTKSLESLLKDLESETDLQLKKQFWEIPLYLQELLGTISEKYVTYGGTKFDTLIRAILKSNFENVLFLTTNYDLFIEKALEKFGYRFEDKFSYIPKDKKISLIKLHGSVNWGKKILNAISVTSETKIVNVLDSISDELKLDQEICLLKGYQEKWRIKITDHIVVYYPTIAVPIEGKTTFLCPRECLERASMHLMGCTNFLFIGFSGLDQSILDLFKLVRGVDKIKIINGTPGAGREMLIKLHRTNEAFLEREETIYGDGFNEFVGYGKLDKFLGI